MSDNTYCEQLARRVVKSPRVKRAIDHDDRFEIWNAACYEFSKIENNWIHPMNQYMKILISYKPVDDGRGIYRPPSFFALPSEDNDGIADCIRATAWHCLGWTVLDLSGS